MIDNLGMHHSVYFIKDKYIVIIPKRTQGRH